MASNYSHIKSREHSVSSSPLTAGAASSSFNFTNGLVVYLNASDPTSMTTVDADANGYQQVQTWADKSGNGNNFVFGTTTHGPDYYSTLFGGRGGVHFRPSGAKSLISAATISPTLTANNMTVLYVLQRLSSYQGPMLVNEPTGDVLDAWPDIGAIGIRKGNVTADGVCGPRLPLNTDVIYTTVMPTNNVMAHYIDTIGPTSTYLGSAGHGSSATVTKLQLAASSLSSATGDFKLGLMLVYNRAFTDVEVVALVNHVKTVLNWNIAAPSKPYNFVLDGNSLVDCRGIDENVWPVKLPALMGIGVNNFTLAGAGGQNITDMRTYATSRVDRYYSTSYLPKYNVVLAWEITNQLIGVNENAASVQALIQAYCQERRAVGWKVIVGTCLPRTTGKANFESDRITVNQWIRDNYLTFADGIADFGANALIGAPGQQNSSYYIGDGVHLAATGHAVVAPIWQAALAAIIA